MENFNKELQRQTKLEERINRILCALELELDGEAYAEKIEEYKRGISIGKAKSVLYKLIKNNGGKLILKSRDGEEGYVSKKSADKLLSSVNKSVHNNFAAEQHFAAVANIDNLFRNSIKVLTHLDNKNRKNILAIHRFVAPLYGDNVAFITVREIAEGEKKIYDIELIELGKLEGMNDVK